MDPQETVNLTHNKRTDVAHVELSETPSTGPVDVVEVGEAVGFPGQILVRFNPETKVVYGITIQGYSSFRRKLMWRHRTLHVANALRALMEKVKAVCGADQNHRMPVLTH